MKLNNALKLLGKYGVLNTTRPVGHDGWVRYYAEVNGVNVNFVDTKGVGVHDYWTADRPDGHGQRKGRKHASLPAALRPALHRRRAVLVTMPDTGCPPLTMAVEVTVTHDGPALRPTPHFHL